jgi:hypothetical protein
MAITLTLELDEVNGILAGLGELPSKTGAWNLIVKIQQQAQPQLPPQDAPTDDTANTPADSAPVDAAPADASNG